MAEILHIHPLNLESRKRDVANWKIAESTRRDVLRFLDDLALGKVNRGKRISERRQLKYLYVLRVPLEFFHKLVAKLRSADIESFEKALLTGKLKSKVKDRAYAHSTQVDFRKALKVFLRWRLGEAKALELAGWLDTRDQLKTPDYLKETEVERLFKACRTAEQRYLIAVLFDGGARAEEFHNLRLEDIQLPEGKDNFVKLALKEEYSKTLGRTISLYWRHSAEAVRDYVVQRIQEGLKPSDPVFPKSYAATRKTLQRLGRTALQRSIHYHLFRHSSATYYASRLNRQELCYRYGWKFSSNMPDIYISRAGMETKDLDTKFTQTELGTVQDEVTKMQQENRIKEERIIQLEQTLRTMQTNMAAIAQVLAANPSVTEVQAALKKMG